MKNYVILLIYNLLVNKAFLCIFPRLDTASKQVEEMELNECGTPIVVATKKRKVQDQI